MKWLFSKQDPAALCVFRILFGCVMFVEARKLVMHHTTRFYSSSFLFGYSWTADYVKLVDPYIMQEMASMAGWASIFCILGFMYRPSIIVFSGVFIYQFLLDQSTFLNHYYLISLVCVFMCFAPANVMYSVDSQTWTSIIRKKHIYNIWYLFINALLFLVYFYAGVAKLNWDWLRGEPMRHWLTLCDVHENRYFCELLVHWSSPYIMSYGGLVFDVFIIPALWFTENVFLFSLIAVIYLVFHIVNFSIFSIGTFPFLGMFFLSLLCNRSWPRLFFGNPTFCPKATKKPNTWKKRAVAGVFACALLVQIFVPLRWALYTSPSQHSWNDLSYNFSWRMKLNNKDCNTAVLVKLNENDTIHELDPIMMKHVTPIQHSYMARKPELLQQYAIWLGKQIANFPGLDGDVVIHMNTTCSLNFRPFQPFFVRTLNLADPQLLGNLHEHILPIRDLPSEYNEQYPWNWDWIGIWHGRVNMTEKQIKWLDANYNMNVRYIT